ncbi:MAG TPA: ATP-binding protein [Candidatus Sulfotelmatobacter sp.]|nr:ATP-binding protein [Candidatus Sulfotelmatobacter sp.]
MKSYWSGRRWWPIVVKYAAAVLFVAAATIITIGLRKVYPSTPNSLFFCAVILSAWLCGWGPGALASLLACVSILLLPRPLSADHAFDGTGPRFAVFLLTSLFISWICARQKLAQTALEQARDELEQRVSDRTAELRTANEGLKTEIAERKRTEALLDGQKLVLEMIAAGEPLTESLSALVRLIEAQTPGMLGSILLIDKLKHHFCAGTGPSLPPEYLKAIYGLPIGPASGSCGTAAYRKEPVVVKDIATDLLWKDYRDMALPHGLRACWSTPILSAQQELLGTFAMYYRHPAQPKPEHWRLVETATHIASIAIGNDRSQSALRESEAKLKQAERIGNIGYWERDIVNDRITISEESWRILGFSPQDRALTQGSLQEMIYPDDRPIQKHALEDALQNRRPYDVEYRIVRPDGEVRFVHVRDKMVYDNSGRPFHMFGTVQDITERKRAEEALRESQQLLQQVLATLPVGVAVTNQKGDIILVNTEAKRIWGDIILTGRERWMQSKGHWHETGKEIGPAEWPSARVLTRGETIVNELIDIETIEGRQKIILNSTAPIRGGEERIVGAVIVNEDVTEQKKSEEKLRQTELELARIARLTIMGELTASIAHEVNQPLAAVVTNANAALHWLAMSPPNLGEVRKAVQRIAGDGTRASEVIRRIRDLMKKGEPDRKPINLNDLVQETVVLIQPELKRKKVSVNTELAPALPLVPADFVQVQQVLLNLIVNAIDSVSAAADHPRMLSIATNRTEPDGVQVAVQDTGTGINPQESERLFEPFYTTKSGGLGMGLAISRSIVEAHGGRLWATPNQGDGATFQFTLPIHDGNES